MWSGDKLGEDGVQGCTGTQAVRGSVAFDTDAAHGVGGWGSQGQEDDASFMEVSSPSCSAFSWLLTVAS